MDRCIVYLFSDGSWLWGVEYNPCKHSIKGDYREIILGRGFSDRDVSVMLQEYYSENMHLFE